MRRFLLFWSALFVTVGAVGQPARSFEKASILPTPVPWRVLRDYSSSGPTLILLGYTVSDLIAEAYELDNPQVMLPASLFRVRLPVYNVVAKAPGTEAPTRAEFREMLQALLTSRFRLKFRMYMARQLTFEELQLKLPPDPHRVAFPVVEIESVETPTVN